MQRPRDGQIHISHPFLGNGSVNTFPMLDRRFLTMQQLDFNNGRDVFSTWSALRCYKQGIRLEPVSCNRVQLRDGGQRGMA
jgi:hypothetical protein